MRVKKIDVCGKPGVNIYISRAENEDPIAQGKIEELKKVYKKMAVFISGIEPMEDNLKKLAYLYSK